MTPSPKAGRTIEGNDAIGYAVHTPTRRYVGEFARRDMAVQFAASPALVEALEEAREFAVNFAELDHPVVKRIDAALRLARGEQP